MWIYEKKLQFPVKITEPDGRMAKIILSQFGGPDGELAASIRYLSQKFTMVTPEAKATLNDIATEEYVYYFYHRKTILSCSYKKGFLSEAFLFSPAMPTGALLS